MKIRSALLTASLALGLCACGSSTPVGDAASVDADLAQRPQVDAAEPTEIRTIPSPLCLADYLGTTGQLYALPDLGLGLPTAIDGGAPATPEIAATLPDFVYLRDTQESYNATHYFAVREGNIYLKANRELTGIDEAWRRMLQPGCLENRVTAVSADGTAILALDSGRWIYTLDTVPYGPLTTGWTRRWGAFFWTDLGEQLPADVSAWATSHTSGDDKIYIDGAGREQDVYGILTIYALRSDGLRITYMDPWLPSDESREVCGPERGSVALAGLTGSGSTVMVISRTGEIYTRLYEFDVSGANTLFFDYSWQDQDDVAQPLFQLPAPEWIHHPRVPGQVSQRVSLRKLPPDTVHRIMRIEGLDGSGHNGYWEKDLTETAWHFTRTDEPLRGTLLPWPGATHYQPEDGSYTGEIEGWAAEVPNFNPYCSPTTLRLQIGSGAPTDLILHSTDGLRQERRARGLNAQPHVYRSAVEVPRALWNARDELPEEVRSFLSQHFGSQRFLTGPLSATPGSLQITMPCWTLHRSTDVADSVLPSLDLGIYVAEILAAQEEGRAPGVCLPGVN
jgi:hypothetical protein